jgi:2-polyprenyl-3-methyl-5-hydroxy-6-metoxy-1,4-benzoquinol methylase
MVGHGDFTASATHEVLEALHRRREALGAERPRIALLLFGGSGAGVLRKTLERIPDAAEGWLEEIVLVPDRGSEGELANALPELSHGRQPRLVVHRVPGDHGYGGARKAAYEYALRLGFDHLITMCGDGRHPPEALPGLLHAALCGDHELVVASRGLRRADSHRAGMSWGRLFGLLVLSELQNHTLGVRLRDYDSGYRVYSARVLRAIPFQLDADDRGFDLELLAQHRALGVPAHEVAVLPPWREPGAETDRDERGYGLRAWGTALGYRLHQLHLLRRGRYLVDRGEPYTLKASETGSHMQIVGAIRPGSRVVDLGCSQGLLAQPLLAKGVRVIGVDEGPGEGVATALEAYYQRDLEEPLDLPVGRAFDYVVVADVIEHIRNRANLLRGARRLLKPGGRLIISTPNIALWFYRLSLLAGRFEYGPRGVLDQTHVHLYTRDSFRRELESAGFHVLEERVTALPFEVVFESTGRSRVVRSAARAYHALARLWPEMFAYQIILDAEIITLDEDAIVSSGTEDSVVSV